MNPEQIAMYTNLAVGTFINASKLIAALRAQGHLTEDQLLAAAAADGAETHAMVRAFLAQLGGDQAIDLSQPVRPARPVVNGDEPKA
jgi:hypothetical protein